MAMNKTVMIVEDDHLNMKLFNDLLNLSGFDTIQKRDGTGAVEAALEHQPDLVLMDIQLPGRSGLDIAQDLKSHEKLKHIPIIAVTAFAHKKAEAVCLSHGCDGYIVKPISVHAFNAMVADFVKSVRPQLRLVH